MIVQGGLKAIAMNVMGVMGVLNLSYMRGGLRFWMMTSIWFRFVLIHFLFGLFCSFGMMVKNSGIWSDREELKFCLEKYLVFVDV